MEIGGGGEKPSRTEFPDISQVPRVGSRFLQTRKKAARFQTAFFEMRFRKRRSNQ
jgi:hypothetical protein